MRKWSDRTVVERGELARPITYRDNDVGTRVL